jgi:hypothetical protein
MIFSLSRDTSFFYSHHAVFALLLPCFDFIFYPFTSRFLLLFSPFVPFSFFFLTFSLTFSPFFFSPFNIFPPLIFFPQMTSADVLPSTGGGISHYIGPCFIVSTKIVGRKVAVLCIGSKQRDFVLKI